MKQKYYYVLFFLIVWFAMIPLQGCKKDEEIRIVFESNGGSAIEDLIMTKTDSSLTFDEPTKDGYQFAGWYTDPELNIVFSEDDLFGMLRSKTIVIYAKWREQEHALTKKLKSIYLRALDANMVDGTYEEWLESIRGEDGLDGKEIYIQISNGFIQWQHEGDALWHNLISVDEIVGKDGQDGKEVMLQVIDDSIHWKYSTDDSWIKLLDVSIFSGKDGVSVLSTKFNDDGELMVEYSDGTKQSAGQVFQKHLVVFRDAFANVMDIQWVSNGLNATEPVNANLHGYRFIGWDKPFNEVTGDMTIYGVYEPLTYNVSFESNGGSIHEDFANVLHGDTIDLPIPEKEGYGFMGWYYGDTVNHGKFTLESRVEKDLTLYAKWTSEVYQVEFIDYNDEILYKTYVLPFTDAVNPEDPVRYGYTFVGWDKPLSHIYQDTIVYAVYEINHYMIYYVTYGGTSIEPLRQPYLTTVTNPLDPTKIGYIFAGWYVDSVLMEPFVFGKPLQEDLILYAKWEMDINSPFNQVELLTIAHVILDAENGKILSGDQIHIKGTISQIDSTSSIWLNDGTEEVNVYIPASLRATFSTYDVGTKLQIVGYYYNDGGIHQIEKFTTSSYSVIP